MLPRSNISFVGSVFTLFDNLLDPSNSAHNGFTIDLICVIFAPLLMVRPDPESLKFLYTHFNEYVLTKDYPTYSYPILTLVTSFHVHNSGNDLSSCDVADAALVNKIKKKLTEDAFVLRKKSDGNIHAVAPDNVINFVHLCVDGEFKKTLCLDSPVCIAQYSTLAPSAGTSKEDISVDINSGKVPLNAKVC